MKFIFKTLLRILIPCVILFAAAFMVLPLPGQIPVLMYHFIDTPDRAMAEKNVVSLESFTEQMAFLKRFGYRVLSMDEYFEIQQGRRKPRGREIVITFDDGNYTFYEKALGVIKRFGHPVTVFVVSQNAIKKIHGSMTPDQIKEISGLEEVTIGGHSRTHPILTELDAEQMRFELQGSKSEIESMIKSPVNYFAYPVGFVNQEVMEETLAAGYRLAFSSSPKRALGLKGPFAITRTKITRTSDYLIAFWVKVSGLYDLIKS